MSRSYRVESSSVEVIPVEVMTVSDPTGGTPSFSATAITASEPSTFTDGTWSGTYDATKKTATALTPTLPDNTATLSLTADTRYKLWIKYVIGSETVIDEVGYLDVV